jgi:fluoroacetyl-CoA thioesterase
MLCVPCDVRPRLLATIELGGHITNAQDSLAPGVEYVLEFSVEGRLLTDVEGTLTTPVLSTPGLVGCTERAAARCVQPYLSDDQATVGFEVCVKHVGAAFEGAQMWARAVLREVIEGRKLRFDVEAKEGDRVIGVGTHERRIINKAS